MKKTAVFVFLLILCSFISIAADNTTAPPPAANNTNMTVSPGGATPPPPPPPTPAPPGSSGSSSIVRSDTTTDQNLDDFDDPFLDDDDFLFEGDQGFDEFGGKEDKGLDTGSKAAKDEKPEDVYSGKGIRTGLLYVIISVLVVVILIGGFFFLKTKKQPQQTVDPNVARIQSYLATNLARGYTQQQLQQELLREGYSMQAINIAFNNLMRR